MTLNLEEAMGIRTERQAEGAASDVQSLFVSPRSLSATEGALTSDTRAVRLAAAGSAAADLFEETDTGWLYRWTGTAWAFLAGLYAATNTTRLALTISAADNGAWFFATDTGVLWQVSAGAWAQRTVGVAGGGTGSAAAAAARTALGIDPVAALKSKLNATAAPAVTDDSAAGYGVGSRWIDTTGQQEYVCINPAVGAAVWKQTTV
jgi:hypothetical protein